jgi:eukaryotic-like serine/threonine-protein kinase
VEKVLPDANSRDRQTLERGGMTPERWQQVKGVLQSALELAPSERAAFLDQSCAGDQALRQEVDSLLEVDSQLAPESRLGLGFLGKSVHEVSVAAGLSSEADRWIGRSVGPYKIVERIGIGGMGEVYRAIRDDEQYRKQVAIKLVRTGQASSLVVSRFKNERQILAGLDHPNIARLLDGGNTGDGAPYFVMELVQGQPLDQYCDLHKLEVNGRLKLFLQVCSAVQYAHQRLIIHRDIKPGNILVTADGVPKLLDFGIAKILDTEADTGELAPTLTAFPVLTPGYASPEQVKGEPITTASDVYSLGVVLYELLTGSSPYLGRTRTANELARAVCELEPQKPSAVLRRTGAVGEQVASQPTQLLTESAREASREKLRKRLNGDLDNILLMALRKEPQRRYASVEQFAEDIRRHLDRLPVIARQDTIRYRTTKFVSRHKPAVVAAALVVVTLLAAFVVTLREARIARVQQARAERRFNDVRKLANSLMFEVHDSIRNLPGATTARKLLVTRALEYLDSLSREAGGDPSLQRELAAAYDKIGDVLGATANPNLGDFQGASESYAKALTIWDSLAAANPADVKTQVGLAGEYFRVTQVLEDMGDFAGARATMQRAQPFIQRIAAGRSDPRLQSVLAGLYYYTATVLEKTQDYSGALQNYQQGAATLESLAADPHTDVFVRAYIVGDYDGLAKMLAETGHLDEAETTAAKALGFIKELSDANPTNATLRSYLGDSYSISGDILQKKGDNAAALDLLHRDREIFKELSSADPHNQEAALNYGLGDLGIGEVLVKQGKISQGLQSMREALATFRAAPGSTNLWVETSLSSAFTDLGNAYAALAKRALSSSEKLRHWREARSWYQKGLEVWSAKPNPAVALDANGKNQAAEITKALAECDVSLQKLNGRTLAQKQ